MTSSSAHFSPKSASLVLTTVCLSDGKALGLPARLTVVLTAESIPLKRGSRRLVKGSFLQHHELLRRHSETAE